MFSKPANLNDITEIQITVLKSRNAISISLMPPGMIKGLNEEEVRDLLPYIRSGGYALS